MADNINDIILRTPHGGTAVLPSGEFEGPVYITKPLHLVGNNTTIWAKRGSVIEITAKDVCIERIRVELTEGSIDDTAIRAQQPASVREVEVLGGVEGFGAEDGYFDIPHLLQLGDFAAESVNSFCFTVNVPTETEIRCGTAGISFSPSVLSVGRNDVTLTVSGIGAQMFLYAEVLFCSAFTRRCYLSGRPRSDAEAAQGRCVYTAPQRENLILLPSSPTAKPAAPKPATDVVSVDAPAPVYDLPLLEMRKGQRVAVYQYIGGKCSVDFTAIKPQSMDIDPYVFLLDNNDRSFGDKGLVFFGNTSSQLAEVRYIPETGTVEIDLEKADYRVQKILLAYSIYAGGAGNSFAQVRSPRVSLSSGGAERISFNMDGLSEETTVVAMEFYRYKGDWKLNAVGAGFRDGMARLCNRFGIEVED